MGKPGTLLLCTGGSIPVKDITPPTPRENGQRLASADEKMQNWITTYQIEERGLGRRSDQIRGQSTSSSPRTIQLLGSVLANRLVPRRLLGVAPSQVLEDSLAVLLGGVACVWVGCKH
jgi:hypothetical protein